MREAGEEENPNGSSTLSASTSTSASALEHGLVVPTNNTTTTTLTTPPAYEDEKARSTCFVITSLEDEEVAARATFPGEKHLPDSPRGHGDDDVSLFDKLHRRVLLVSALLALPLFLNLLLSPVSSASWIDANRYLALKAGILAIFHSTAASFRVLFAGGHAGRKRGAVPWFLDAMYAVFHVACFGLHAWCVLQAGGDIW